MNEVIIAGSGFAGSLAALRLLQLGFQPRLLHREYPDIDGVEIIPAHLHRLLEILQLGPVLAGLRPTRATGMMRRWARTGEEFRPGHALHVQRLPLRRGMLAEAARRGAAIEHLDRPPQMPWSRRDGVHYRGRRFVAALDATGRRAAWSRPIIRYGRTVADVFSLPAAAPRPYGEVVQLRAGWAYRADHDGLATIGIVGSPRRRPERLPDEVAAALSLPHAGSARYLGRRPAFAQAAASALRGRVLAVGDAAFAHDPIGGRGLSFAAGSAFAAAATLQTLRDRPESAAAAVLYYRRYVASEQARHLAFLGDFYGSASGKPPLALPDNLKWRGRVLRTALSFDDGIRMGQAVRLGDGGVVRWLGQFDLLRVREICSSKQPLASVMTRLMEDGLTEGRARALLTWALEKGLVASA